MELPSIFQFQGWDIHYSIQSSEHNPTQPRKNVVFVHGTPWSSIVYKPIIEALLAKGSFRILAYDLPGYGQSQKLVPTSTTKTSDEGFLGDTSVQFQAEALAALLHDLELDGKGSNIKPAVVAHDIAGTIVLRAHLLHDCEFHTMMLVDANTVLPWGDGFYKLARSEAKTFLQLPSGVFEAVVRAVIQSACHNPNVLKTGWEDALAEPWLDLPSTTTDVGEHQRSFVRQIAQANDADVAEMLDQNLYERVRCDVKIIWGEEDKWIPRHKIETLIQKLGSKAKEHAFIPRAGHLVMLDQPERFAIETFDWLSKVPHTT